MIKHVTTTCLVILFTMAIDCQPLKDLPIHKSKMVICDNDDHRDVYTDEYLLALSHLGKINLTGIITTYAPNKKEYQLFIEGRKEIVEKAKKSGMRNLPQAFAGTDKRLVQPATNKITDTQPLDIPASRFIVEQAKNASPKKPLVIVAGGQLTTIANAYLLDASIAKNIIVSGIFGVQQMDYNAGLDGWAWKIVLSKFRVFAVPIGPSKNRGTVYMKPPVVSKAEIKQKLPQSIPFFSWMHEKKHPGNNLPDGHDYDGQAAIPLIRPDYITKIKRWRVEGLDKDGNLKLVEDTKGNIFEALDANQEIATQEFWRAMTVLKKSL